MSHSRLPFGFRDYPSILSFQFTPRTPRTLYHFVSGSRLTLSFQADILRVCPLRSDCKVAPQVPGESFRPRPGIFPRKARWRFFWVGVQIIPECKLQEGLAIWWSHYALSCWSSFGSIWRRCLVLQVDLDAAAFSSWKEASERCRREVLVSLHFHNFSYTLLIYVNLLHLVTSSHLLDTFAQLCDSAKAAISRSCLFCRCVTLVLKRPALQKLES